MYLFLGNAHSSLAVEENHIFKVLSKGSEQQDKKRGREKDKANVIKREHLENLGKG